MSALLCADVSSDCARQPWLSRWHLLAPQHAERLPAPLGRRRYALDPAGGPEAQRPVAGAVEDRLAREVTHRGSVGLAAAGDEAVMAPVVDAEVHARVLDVRALHRPGVEEQQVAR